MELNICWFLPLPAAVVAEARGLCRQRGLIFRASNVRSSDEQFEMLASDVAQAVVTAMDNVFEWNRRGVIDDLRVVAEMERSTLSVLMGAPGVNTIEKLRGGVLLVDSAANGFVVVTRSMLREAGLELGDYRLNVVGGVMARVEALCHGEGDAALLVPLFEQRVLDAGGHILVRVNDVYPDFPGQGLVVRRRRLNNCRAALEVWLQALSEAGKWIQTHPNEAAAIVVGETGLPREAAEEMLAATPWRFRPTAAALERVVAQRRQLGLPGAEDGVPALFDDGLTN